MKLSTINIEPTRHEVRWHSWSQMYNSIYEKIPENVYWQVINNVCNRVEHQLKWSVFTDVQRQIHWIVVDKK